VEQWKRRKESVITWISEKQGTDFVISFDRVKSNKNSNGEVTKQNDIQIVSKYNRWERKSN
jgi:hypothetical protein